MRPVCEDWGRVTAGEREKEHCAWKAGTEAGVPGGGVGLPMVQGSLFGPRNQSTKTAKAVPEFGHAATAHRPELARGVKGGMGWKEEMFLSQVSKDIGTLQREEKGVLEPSW